MRERDPPGRGKVKRKTEESSNDQGKTISKTGKQVEETETKRGITAVEYEWNLEGRISSQKNITTREKHGILLRDGQVSRRLTNHPIGKDVLQKHGALPERGAYLQS